MGVAEAVDGASLRGRVRPEGWQSYRPQGDRPRQPSCPATFLQVLSRVPTVWGGPRGSGGVAQAQPTPLPGLPL